MTNLAGHISKAAKHYRRGEISFAQFRGVINSATGSIIVGAVEQALPSKPPQFGTFRVDARRYARSLRGRQR